MLTKLYEFSTEELERYRKHGASDLVDQYIILLQEYLKNKPDTSQQKLKETTIDVVNKPPHYRQHPSGVECIQITEHMVFNLGNAVKYIWRADLKNGLEDLKKAEWYIKREIERRQKGYKP